MWHSPTDKSAFVGAVGFRITCQETQEKSWPASHSVHWVIGLQILDLKWPMNQLQLLSTKDWEPLGNTVLDSDDPMPSTDGRVLIEVQVFSREVLAQPWRKKQKKSMSGHVGEGKWNSLALPTQRLPETAKPRARRALLSCDSSHGGRWWMVQGKGTCEWAPGFSSYAGCYQRGPLPSHTNRVLNPQRQDWRQ